MATEDQSSRDKRRDRVKAALENEQYNPYADELEERFSDQWDWSLDWYFRALRLAYETGFPWQSEDIYLSGSDNLIEDLALTARSLFVYDVNESSSEICFRVLSATDPGEGSGISFDYGSSDQQPAIVHNDSVPKEISPDSLYANRLSRSYKSEIVISEEQVGLIKEDKSLPISSHEAFLMAMSCRLTSVSVFGANDYERALLYFALEHRNNSLGNTQPIIIDNFDINDFDVDSVDEQLALRSREVERARTVWESYINDPDRIEKYTPPNLTRQQALEGVDNDDPAGTEDPSDPPSDPDPEENKGPNGTEIPPLDQSQAYEPGGDDIDEYGFGADEQVGVDYDEGDVLPEQVAQDLDQSQAYELGGDDTGGMASSSEDQVGVDYEAVVLSSIGESTNSYCDDTERRIFEGFLTDFKEGKCLKEMARDSFLGNAMLGRERESLQAMKMLYHHVIENDFKAAESYVEEHGNARPKEESRRAKELRQLIQGYSEEYAEKILPHDSMNYHV